MRIITLTKQGLTNSQAACSEGNIGAPEIDVTLEMSDAGAKMLEHQLWLLDPFTKPLPIGALKLIVPDVYRVMAALAVPK